eukprot:7302824-Alexandrium_andersonii.AAC.1
MPFRARGLRGLVWVMARQRFSGNVADLIRDLAPLAKPLGRSWIRFDEGAKPTVDVAGIVAPHPVLA